MSIPITLFKYCKDGEQPTPRAVAQMRHELGDGSKCNASAATHRAGWSIDLNGLSVPDYHRLLQLIDDYYAKVQDLQGFLAQADAELAKRVKWKQYRKDRMSAVREVQQ